MVCQFQLATQELMTVKRIIYFEVAFHSGPGYQKTCLYNFAHRHNYFVERNGSEMNQKEEKPACICIAWVQ